MIVDKNRERKLIVKGYNQPDVCCSTVVLTTGCEGGASALWV